MIMCVLCSWQVVIFLLVVIPWEPQHAKFSVITSIVIIGCFSSCIKARYKIFLSYFEQVNDFELSSLKIKKNFLLYTRKIYLCDWYHKTFDAWPKKLNRLFDENNYYCFLHIQNNFVLPVTRFFKKSNFILMFFQEELDSLLSVGKPFYGNLES